MSGSAGGCERNWSTYDFITNRNRNNLAPQRAEDLVYVHYNRRCVLKSREPEEFASWLHEDVQLLPVEGSDLCRAGQVRAGQNRAELCCCSP